VPECFHPLPHRLTEATSNFDSLTLKSGIHQDHPGSFLRVCGSEVPHHWSTIGVAYEHVRAALTKFEKGVVQFEI